MQNPSPPAAVDTSRDLPPRDTATGSARGGRARTAGFLIVAAVLLLMCAASLALGARSIPLEHVWQALVHDQGSATDLAIVRESRLPRTVIGLLAGIGLGISGALIQAVTRNPIADPGILGVTAGSAFLVAIAVGVLGVTAPSGYLWFAFAGALLAAVVVYLIGSAGPGGASPARLTLAGVALGAVLAGVTAAIRLSNPDRFTAMTAWASGSLADRTWSGVGLVAPFVGVGVLIALTIGGSLNAVALGDDLAAALGANVFRTRVYAVVAVGLLAGGATALAGPITFVGLMIPHIARWVVGPDQRWILAYSILLAPVLLLAADIVGRMILRPGEVPAGVVTAVIGAPVLIYLVRRQRADEL